MIHVQSLRNTIILFLTIFLLASCASEEVKEKPVEDVKTEQQPTTLGEYQAHPGQKLMENKCNLCHNATTPMNSLVAPPMISVKAHYIKEGISKEDFIHDFTTFASSPDKDKVKMKMAAEKFGLMPNQNFDKEDLKKIAEYIFDYEIEEPTWFKKHWEKEHGETAYINTGKKSVESNPENMTNAERGKSYALGTKKVLGKNLMGTIQKKGTLAALQFCNLKAYGIADSMSNVFGASIERVSDKPRNANNAADNNELAIIASFKKMLANNEKIKPVVRKENGKVQFYMPIKTNTMCLQCHGTPNTNVKEDVLAELKKLYPKDKALGYSENQVRGIWHVEFDEK